MSVLPEPLSVGVVVSGLVVLGSAAALARQLVQRQGRQQDDLGWPIIVPACGLIIGLMGFALSVLPLGL